MAGREPQEGTSWLTLLPVQQSSKGTLHWSTPRAAKVAILGRTSKTPRAQGEIIWTGKADIFATHGEQAVKSFSIVTSLPL